MHLPATEAVARFHQVAAMPSRADVQHGKALGEYRFAKTRECYLKDLSEDFRIEVRPGITTPALSQTEIDDHTAAGHQRVIDVLLWLQSKTSAVEAIAMQRLIDVERQLIDRIREAAVLHDVHFGGMK